MEQLNPESYKQCIHIAKAMHGKGMNGVQDCADMLSRILHTTTNNLSKDEKSLLGQIYERGCHQEILWQIQEWYKLWPDFWKKENIDIDKINIYIRKLYQKYCQQKFQQHKEDIMKALKQTRKEDSSLLLNENIFENELKKYALDLFDNFNDNIFLIRGAAQRNWWIKDYQWKPEYIERSYMLNANKGQEEIIDCWSYPQELEDINKEGKKNILLTFLAFKERSLPELKKCYTNYLITHSDVSYWDFFRDCIQPHIKKQNYNLWKILDMPLEQEDLLEVFYSILNYWWHQKAYVKIITKGEWGKIQEFQDEDQKTGEKTLFRSAENIQAAANGYHGKEAITLETINQEGKRKLIVSNGNQHDIFELE